MTNQTCARCGGPHDQKTPGCKACYHRHYYRTKHHKPTPTREPIYAGTIAGRAPALNNLIPKKREPDMPHPSTCRTCNAPLDQRTPGCPTCTSRHYARAYNKKTPARNLKAAQEHAATLAAYQAWLNARRQRIAANKPKNHPKPTYEPIYTEAEAAHYTNLSRPAITIARQKGHLHPDPNLTELAGHTIYKQTELDRWLDSRLPYDQITEALGKTTPHALAFATLWKSTNKSSKEQLEAIHHTLQHITNLSTHRELTAKNTRTLTEQLTKMRANTHEFPLTQQRDTLIHLIRTALPTRDGNDHTHDLATALYAWEQAIKQPH